MVEHRLRVAVSVAVATSISSLSLSLAAATLQSLPPDGATLQHSSLPMVATHLKADRSLAGSCGPRATAHTAATCCKATDAVRVKQLTQSVREENHLEVDFPPAGGCVPGETDAMAGPQVRMLLLQVAVNLERLLPCLDLNFSCGNA